MKQLLLALVLVVATAPAFAVQQPARVKTWTDEVLTAADLNAEFDQIHTYIEAQLLGSGNALTIPGGDSMFVDGWLQADTLFIVSAIFERGAGSVSRIGTAATPIDSLYVTQGRVTDSLHVDTLVVGGVFTASAGARATIAHLDPDSVLSYTMYPGQLLTAANVDADTLSGTKVITDTTTFDPGVTVAIRDSLHVDSLVVGAWATFAGATVADLGTVTTVDINGGTVDGITSLTVDADLAFTGPQAITTSSGALTVNPATGTIFTPSSTSVTGLDFTESGAVTDGIYGVKIYTNANQQESALVYIHSDNASSDHGVGTVSGEAGVLYVRSDGTAAAMSLENTTAGEAPLSLWDSGDYTSPIRLHGGFSADIADNAVDNLLTKSGLFLVHYLFLNASTGAIQASGVVTARSAATVSCAVTQFVSTTTVAASTTDLVGTTGVDGQITISAHDDIIEIENRSGAITSGRFFIVGN